MIFSRKSIRICTRALSIIVVAFLPHVLHAASIQFDGSSHTVGTNSPFLVHLTIDSDTPVNAIRVVIDIPEYTDVVDVSDGNSVINMWIERPHLISPRQLVFAGIVPGGFKGIRGTLITFAAKSFKEGKGSFIVNASSRVYANDEHATPQTITSRPLDLAFVNGRDNVITITPDRAPPEPFKPILVKMPDGDVGSWAVSFETQDKDSGIASYSVVESVSRHAIDATDTMLRLPWREVESPYILADQQLQSYVYIKATDVMGNSRFGYIAPIHGLSWYRTPGGYILIALLIFTALYVIARRLHVVTR